MAGACSLHARLSANNLTAQPSISQDHFNRNKSAKARYPKAANHTLTSTAYPFTTMRSEMSVNSAILRAQCGGMLILAFAIQSAAAGEQRARKHHHVHTVSQCRPLDANAALTQAPSDPWWARFANGAGSAPAGH